MLFILLIFIGKSMIVFNQAAGLSAGVSGEAGFLRTNSDFVRKKSYVPFRIITV